MKKKWLVAALAALMMTTAVFAASPKFPSYLIMDGTTVAGVKNQKKLPADLVIPEGATAIGKGAFRGCTLLESVTIPNSVTTIGYDAFSGCTSLASVTIPGSVTAIGDDAFKGCTSLKKIQFGGTVTQWKAVKGSDNVDASSIHCSDGYLGVKEVPEYLKMEGTKVTGNIGMIPENLVIPDGVTEIGYGAFQYRISIVSVTIPVSVTAIGDDAFKGCASLKEIQFKGTVAQWEAIQKDGAIPIGVRCRDGNIAAEVVPNLKMDGTVVTGYTGTLPAKLVIPMGVTSIGWGAFHGCDSLESVTIPSSVKKIDAYYDGAFSGCTSLKEIQFKGTKAQWEAIQGSDKVKVSYIRFSDGYIGVKEVPAYLKMEGTKVTGYTGKVPANLVIPDGVTAIGGDAFKNCTSLEIVTIPASVTDAASAFVDCTYLERVTIADGVTKISSSMFSGCTSLKSVSIPGSVKEIESSAFSGCAGLTSITIPDSVTKIGWEAFSGCASLKSVIIPSSVKKISSSTFSGCKSLVSVTISNSVTEIGGSAFYGCSSLASVTIPNSVTEIGGGAFSGCTSLKSVTIPDSVTGGLYAFYSCTSLVSITIGNGVTEIGGFSGCTSLKSVTIPRGVTSIDEKAFLECTSLASVSIPRSVTSIDYAAFEKCPNLKVQYDGTKAQWEAIVIYGKLKATIQCSDGIITN